MRARIVKREEDRIVLMTEDDKLLRVPKDSLDFEHKIGDYVTIEKCEDEIFILPCDESLQADSIETTRAKEVNISRNDDDEAKNEQHITHIVAGETPSWLTNIRENDKNFTTTIALATAFIFGLPGITLIVDMRDRYGTLKKGTLEILIIAIVFASILLIRAIVLKQKISKYFCSEEFQHLKHKISKNAKDINELNQHVQELKGIDIVNNRIDQGKSTLVSGGYNYRRPGWKLLQDNQSVHYCGLQVVKNSKAQPFKYVCKYFGLKPDEETLNKIEEMFNNFSAAEQGMQSLVAERNSIIAGIDSQIPQYIKNYVPNRLFSELGIEKIDLETPYFPTYSFRYVSPGGNSTADNTVVMDLDNLERFIEFVGAQIKWRKSIAGQRALMTTALRESIKQRDHFTCRKCGACITKEPHLLLEIDHIIPLAKGGLTTEKNLQTLCWRCNRAKGAK